MDVPRQSTIIPRARFTSQFDASMLGNISWSDTQFNSHFDVAAWIKDKHPYTITVLIESLKLEYRNKKEFVKKTKHPIETVFRTLLFEYFFQEFGREKGNDLYRTWLVAFNNDDEAIIESKLDPMYRDRILQRFPNHTRLFAPRNRIDRDRYYNLPKPLDHVDWRNPYDNIFVWHENGKKVAKKGGSGSSGGREMNSLFIYGLLELSKIQPIPSYLFLYSEKNTLLFIRRFDALCVPFHDLGSNYHPGHLESATLKKYGSYIEWSSIDRIEQVEVMK